MMIQFLIKLYRINLLLAIVLSLVNFCLYYEETSLIEGFFGGVCIVWNILFFLILFFDKECVITKKVIFIRFCIILPLICVSKLLFNFEILDSVLSGYIWKIVDLNECGENDLLLANGFLIGLVGLLKILSELSLITCIIPVFNLNLCSVLIKLPLMEMPLFVKEVAASLIMQAKIEAYIEYVMPHDKWNIEQARALVQHFYGFQEMIFKQVDSCKGFFVISIREDYFQKFPFEIFENYSLVDNTPVQRVYELKNCRIAITCLKYDPLIARADHTIVKWEAFVTFSGETFTQSLSNFQQMLYTQKGVVGTFFVEVAPSVFSKITFTSFPGYLLIGQNSIEKTFVFKNCKIVIYTQFNIF